MHSRRISFGFRSILLVAGLVASLIRAVAQVPSNQPGSAPSTNSASAEVTQPVSALDGTGGGRHPAGAAANTDGSELRIEHLRCEYLKDPAGIDSVKPRLDWKLSSDHRGEQQTAYRILVASSPELLAQDHGDLWDTAKVPLDQMAQIEYGGSTLASRQLCVWKVMVWNKGDQPSAWSETARWSMGLLRPDDWQAQWISDATLADPANCPLTPIHCYRSELASSPDTNKWIVVDLGSSRNIDMINVVPARPRGLNTDFRTVMFPLRFKIEVSDDPNFIDAKVVVDKASEDFEAPALRHVSSAFPRFPGAMFGLL